MSKVSRSGGSQTVDRALAVLQCIASAGTPVLLDDLAAQVGLHTSVVYRLVRSLVAAGFVRRDPDIGGYSAGATLVSMAVSLTGRIDLRGMARGVMETIVAEFGETASLHIRAGDQRVCVEAIEGTHEIRRVVQVGETLPLFTGETGRIFLAALSPVEQRRLIGDAEAAGLDPARLLSDLEPTLKRGYFIGVGERTPDVGSISVKVSGPQQLFGVITVSGPVNRWSRQAMESAAPRIVSLVQSISTAPA